FLEQGVVASHLAPQRRLAQEPGFESRRILRILPAQRVERGHGPRQARLEDGVDELDDALAENRARPHRMGAGKLLDQKAREEQHFEAVAKSIREKAHDSEPTIEEKGRSEGERESKRRLRDALVAETSPAPRAFAKRFGVSQQRLYGRRRGRALRHDFER